jgi:hypothetical protein
VAYHLLGEKNGRKTGRKFCIVVSDAGGVKLGVWSREFSVVVAVVRCSQSFQFSSFYLSPITIKYEQSRLVSK